MTGTGAAGSLSTGVNLLPGCGCQARMGLWVRRSLGSALSWLVGLQRFQEGAGSRSRGGSPESAMYLSALATADSLEQKLRLINDEIAEQESRLRKLAQF